MLHVKDIEIIEQIYKTIARTQVDSIHEREHKVSCIQNIVAQHLKDTTVEVDVGILNKTMTVTYGLLLTRKSTYLNTDRLPDYRLVSPEIDHVARLAGSKRFYDSYENTEEYPIFGTQGKVHQFTLPSFADELNGNILDLVIDYTLLTNTYCSVSSGKQQVQQAVDKIDISSYLTPKHNAIFANLLTVVQIATHTCIKILEEKLVDHPDVLAELKQAEADKYLAAIVKEAEIAGRNDLGPVGGSQRSRIEHEANAIQAQNEKLENATENVTKPKNNANIPAVTWGTKPKVRSGKLTSIVLDMVAERLLDEIKKYVEGICPSERVKTPISSYGPLRSMTNPLLPQLGLIEVKDFKDFEGDVTETYVNKLEIVKQFMRLLTLAKQKMGEHVAADSYSLNIGQLYPDGNFIKNDKLIGIVIDVVDKSIIEPADLIYVIDLYADSSHIIGMPNESR